MDIVHITSELTPLAKAGGLADVVYGLARELSKTGSSVTVILPKYDCLHLESLNNLKVQTEDLWSFDGQDRIRNTVWSASSGGLNLLLIEPHHPQQFFNRGMIYGCPDDIDRFCYFSRAAMEYLFKSGSSPDVIHVHDWPTAIVPILYKQMYQELGFQAGGTLLTIHNMQHQGKCLPENLSRTGLKGEDYLSSHQMQDPLIARDINLLKGGIVYADKITTVSPTYEKEILTAEGAFGLEDTLNAHSPKLKGILNGIDEEFWNPEKDPYLYKNYPAYPADKRTLSLVLNGKQANKRHLQKELGLKEGDLPIVAVIARLVPQKSPDLIKYALFRTLELGGQFILLGNTPIPSIHSEFEALQLELKSNPQVSILMDKNEELAHQIYASSDMLLIPSRFEPCGLTQLIALRYGGVPIARLTGGLCDTVFDIDTSQVPLDLRNGFTFEQADFEGIDGALTRALECYETNRKTWESLVIHGMQKNYSWKAPAEQYLSLYKEIVSENIPLKAKEIA